MKVINTLRQREKKYGDYQTQAELTQNIVEAMKEGGSWTSLDAGQNQALNMIALKVGRLLNGDPNDPETWHDIAGYATLVETYLNGETIGVNDPEFPDALESVLTLDMSHVIGDTHEALRERCYDLGIEAGRELLAKAEAIRNDDSSQVALIADATAD